MGKRSCTMCGGRGFTMTSEWRPNPMGGLGQNVTIRRTCNACAGSGSVWAPDPPQPPRPGGGTSQKPRAPKGGSGKPGEVPWGFRRKKKADGEKAGRLTLEEDGTFTVEPTQEERERAGALLVALASGLVIAGGVGYQLNLWVSVAIPALAGGAVYWFLRKNPVWVRAALGVFFLAVLGGFGYLIYLFVKA